MVISFLQILQESVKKLLPSAEHKASQLGAAAIGAMAGTVGLKGLIWICCSPIKTSQVQALKQGTNALRLRIYLAKNVHTDISSSTRLQNRRILQHPLPPLPPNRRKSRHMVAGPSRRRSPLPVHHLRLVIHPFRKRRSTNRHWRKRPGSEKTHVPRLAVLPYC